MSDSAALANAKPNRVVSTLTDLTTTEETCSVLARSRHDLEAVLDATPGVVFRFIEGPGVGTFEFVSHGAWDILGLDPKSIEADPESLWARLAPDERPKIHAHFADCRDKGVPVERTVRLCPSSSPQGGRVGTRRGRVVGAFNVSKGSQLSQASWVRVHAVPETRADGGVCWTGVILDASEAKLLAEQLEGAQRREAMGDLAAGVAHNFNNMLAAILPNIQLAMRFANEAAQSPLEDAQQAALNAADLVRRLMALGRGDNSERATRTLDLRGVVDETLRICRSTFDRRILIEFESPGEPIWVRGRHSSLSQVVLNLCLNARDALIDVGGRLKVRLSGQGDPPGLVQLEVEDTGSGMSKDTAARVGEPFSAPKNRGKERALGWPRCSTRSTLSRGRCLVRLFWDAGRPFTYAFPRPARLDQGSDIPFWNVFHFCDSLLNWLNVPGKLGLWPRLRQRPRNPRPDLLSALRSRTMAPLHT